jgi:hypothetical protein
MNQADRRRFGVHNVYCAAVRDIDAKRNTPLIRDDSVAVGKFTTGRVVATTIDRGDFVSMNLLSCAQRPVAHPRCTPDFVVRGIQPLQHLGFLVRNVDAGNSLCESVTTNSNVSQSRKLFEE